MAEKGGIPQCFKTTGNVEHPVEGLSNDAGLGKPPAPDAYGPVSTSPSLGGGEKKPGGNSKALEAYFGTKSPGGGK